MLRPSQDERKMRGLFLGVGSGGAALSAGGEALAEAGVWMMCRGTWRARTCHVPRHGHARQAAQIGSQALWERTPIRNGVLLTPPRVTAGRRARRSTTMLSSAAPERPGG